MGKDSGIEWTDHTFNPWIGCTKVSPGCKFCYAEREMDKRWGKAKWGPKGTRTVTGDAYWRQPVKWNAIAAQEGKRARVFSASQADAFEGRDTMPAEAWAGVEDARSRLWPMIEQTPWLEWMLLTKRPENILPMIPPHWYTQLPDNVRFGTSAEDQDTYNERVPILLATNAPNFLSLEPLIAPINPVWIPLSGAQQNGDPVGASSIYPLTGERKDMGRPCQSGRKIDWVIVGGESGSEARPMHPDWVRTIRDACKTHRVPFFFKQWGEWAPGEVIDRTPTRTERTADWNGVTWLFGAVTPTDSSETHRDDQPDLYRVGVKASTPWVDAVKHTEFPEIGRPANV